MARAGVRAVAVPCLLQGTRSRGARRRS